MPVLHPGGLSAYSCGPVRGHREVPAEPVEHDLLLKTLVRAAFTLKHPTLVATEEARRWRLVNPLDSHAMLVAGFVRVDVDDSGAWHPVWRHETDGAMS
ncbi:MAG: hypothetical protein GEU94_17310 [Micromonosporaceae bacterium]|nr:hypothetical protein [Micromonosporaceae bacterium]